jgi:RimJ/RimL family protein N-acetyltransferase
MENNQYLGNAMKITFTPLLSSHFPLLLKWLETPHVKAWWDQDISWTPELIQEKYGSYVNGYKIQDGIKKPFTAMIIGVNDTPVGYLQVYNPYDFPGNIPLQDLPLSLAAFDIFIGEKAYLRKGIALNVLTLYFAKYVPFRCTHIFADPDQANLAAIQLYEKAGFHKIKEWPEQGIIWMLKELNGC